MSGVDQLQNAEEFVEQARDEERRERRAMRAAELREPPLSDTAGKAHRPVTAAVAQVRTLQNMRVGGLPEIHELAISIKETGLLHPPLVRATGDEERPYELLAGRRRLAAMAMLDESDGAREDWRFTLVEDISRREALTMQFAENFHQSKPEPVQFARAARAIMAEDDALTAADVSRLVGAPTAWTRKALRLLDLPEAIVARVEQGDLSFTVADVVRRGIARGDVSDAAAEELVEQHAAGEISGGALKLGVGYQPPKPKDYEEQSRRLDEARAAGDREQERERGEWYGEGAQNVPRIIPAPAAHERSEVSVREDVAAEDLDAYLVGLVLGRVIPEERRRALGLRDQSAAHDYAFTLRPAERLGVLRSLAGQLLADDAAPPRALRARAAA